MYVTQKWPRALNKLQRLFGTGKVSTYSFPSLGHKPMSYFYLGGAHLWPVLCALEPYFVTKRVLCRAMLTYIYERYREGRGLKYRKVL